MTALDTGTDDLLVDIDDGVAVVTFNRPDRRNAFSPAMVNALARTLAAVEADDAVGAVVLTGAGGAFCAGGDVKAMAGDEALFPGDSIDARIELQRRNQRETAGRLWTMAKPTLAALPGPAAGAGLALALACDLRYAADTAVLATAFARVGFSGDYGGTWFLSRLIGTAKAKELYFFSERLSAAEAVRLGVVNDVFPADTVVAETIDRARRLAHGPRIALRYMKENLNRAVTAGWADCADIEVTHHVHCGLTDDHREAAAAFVAKREPAFRGR